MRCAALFGFFALFFACGCEASRSSQKFDAGGGASALPCSPDSGCPGGEEDPPSPTTTPVTIASRNDGGTALTLRTVVLVNSKVVLDRTESLAPGSTVLLDTLQLPVGASVTVRSIIPATGNSGGGGGTIGTTPLTCTSKALYEGNLWFPSAGCVATPPL